MIIAYMGIKPVTLTLIVLVSLKIISRLYIKILNLHDQKDYRKLFFKKFKFPFKRKGNRLKHQHGLKTDQKPLF